MSERYFKLSRMQPAVGHAHPMCTLQLLLTTLLARTVIRTSLHIAALVCIRQAEAEKREKARQEAVLREANRRAAAERSQQVCCTLYCPLLPLAAGFAFHTFIPI